MFTYVHSLLIEKDVYDRWNISNKLPCAFPPEISSIFGKSFPFPFPYFVLCILRSNLFLELQVETIQRIHSCTVCNRKFQHKAARDRHMQLHSEEKTGLKCSVCERIFLRPKFLKRHMAEHESRNECSLCNKTFISRRQLKVHLSTHSGSAVKNK